MKNNKNTHRTDKRNISGGLTGKLAGRPSQLLFVCFLFFCFSYAFVFSLTKQNHRKTNKYVPKPTLSQIGGLALYVKYADIVASDVPYSSVVLNDLQKLIVF